MKNSITRLTNYDVTKPPQKLRYVLLRHGTISLVIMFSAYVVSTVREHLQPEFHYYYAVLRHWDWALFSVYVCTCVCVFVCLKKRVDYRYLYFSRISFAQRATEF